jgi:glutamyl-tRNA synthetase
LRVRTRFAPSPTGYLHIGSVRTALYAWLFARHHGGEFLLRIEDTDRERSTQLAVEAILEGMAWLGLDADAPPLYQSQRLDRYGLVAERLIEEGKAYRCYCSREEIEAMRADAQARGLKPRYDGRCRARTAPAEGVLPVVRFRNPDDGVVVVDDIVRGRIEFDNAELDDLIILRSDGTPTYNFTVVVDDADSEVTHVIRGDDHVNNTPRQLNLLSAIGVSPPAYAHLPMIHGSDGAKLSKRHGAVNVLEYREMGFLPEALLNYLLRLGWSHGDQEIFSLDEMTELFDLDRVSRSASNFDLDKLCWVNQQHIMSADVARLAGLLAQQLKRIDVSPDSGPPLEHAVEALRERSRTIVEMAERARCYYEEFEDFEPKAAKSHLKSGSREPLLALKAGFEALTEWSADSTQAEVESIAERLDQKLGRIAQPLRVAITGSGASPGIGITLELVGRERSIARIDRAIDYIDARSASG